MSAVLSIIRWWLISENDVYEGGGPDKGSTATATTGHAVAAEKGEAYYAGSVRCHFRLSTVMMDKDNAHTGYIQKKDAASVLKVGGIFFVLCPASFACRGVPWGPFLLF
jgi:hypothetical protein